MDLNRIKEQATKELKEEEFRKEVEKYKEKLRSQKGFWVRLFPYRILIIRKEV